MSETGNNHLSSKTPGPEHFMLTADETVVCLIDLQDRLLAAMPENETLVENVRTLVRGVKLLDVPIIWSEQYPKGLGPTVDQISKLLPEETLAEKLDFSAWREASFMKLLKATNRKTVILPGIETHVCVMQTALDLLGEGYRVFVPSDAVSSRSEKNKEVGLNIMKEAGAVITSVETCIFQMFEKAGSDAFKAFQKLIA